jgi:hypothetical protein
MANGVAQQCGGGQSMAVWYANEAGTHENISSGEEPKATLHFNLWHFKPEKERQKTFLDIGLLLHDAEKVGDIFFYIPTKNSGTFNESVTDLAPKFKNIDTVTGVFNEPLSCEVREDKFIHLNKGTDSKENVLFARMKPLDDDEWERVCDQSTGDLGTIIKIKKMAIDRVLNELPSGACIYFRFRFKFFKSSKNPFIQTIKPGDFHLLSGFERLDCVDFRLNELRNLPSSISSRLRDSASKRFGIQEINFLLATDAKADYVSGHRQFHKCRMLERGLWREYVEGNLPAHMVIYHWKVPHGQGSDVPFREFNAFLKFRVREANWKTILRFVIIAGVVGAIGSYISNYIPLVNGDRIGSYGQDAQKNQAQDDGQGTD